MEHLPDKHLDARIEKRDFHTLGSLFGGWLYYASNPGLRLTESEISSIHVDLNLTNEAMRMAKALTFWQNNNPLQATFRNLIDIVKKLKKGNVAIEISKYVGKGIFSEKFDVDELAEWLERKELPYSDRKLLKDLGYNGKKFSDLGQLDADALCVKIDGLTQQGGRILCPLLQETNDRSEIN